MLAVRVQPAAVVVPALERLAIASRDPDREPAVLAEADHARTAGAGDLRRLIRRAVVDDEKVDTGKVAPRLLEHTRKRFRLVPGRDEDEGVDGWALVARPEHQATLSRARDNASARRDLRYETRASVPPIRDRGSSGSYRRVAAVRSLRQVISP